MRLFYSVTNLNVWTSKTIRVILRYLGIFFSYFFLRATYSFSIYSVIAFRFSFSSLLSFAIILRRVLSFEVSCLSSLACADQKRILSFTRACLLARNFNRMKNSSNRSRVHWLFLSSAFLTVSMKRVNSGKKNLLECLDFTPIRNSLPRVNIRLSYSAKRRSSLG